MPDSFCHLAAHIIFSTKNRKTWLKPPLAEAMHSYLGGIINKTGGKAIRINGIPDHVHILCLLPKDLGPADFIAKIKANSSKWFRGKHCPEFNWQSGYAMFSVSKSNMDEVSRYITDQDEHHFHTTAWEEFDALLKKHWDPDKL